MCCTETHSTVCHPHPPRSNGSDVTPVASRMLMASEHSSLGQKSCAFWPSENIPMAREDICKPWSGSQNSPDHSYPWSFPSLLWWLPSLPALKKSGEGEKWPPGGIAMGSITNYGESYFDAPPAWHSRAFAPLSSE